jgi:hypothetical protein
VCSHTQAKEHSAFNADFKLAFKRWVRHWSGLPNTVNTVSKKYEFIRPNISPAQKHYQSMNILAKSSFCNRTFLSFPKIHDAKGITGGQKFEERKFLIFNL